MEAALYGEGGFFASGHGAGRAGRDFVTSPEVGSLFGVCVARAIDRLWKSLGEPDPFLVVEAGAGNGRLAREILRAKPFCSSALRYVLVERSAELRTRQRELLPLEPPDEALGPFARRRGEDAPVPEAGAGPVFAAVDDLPALEVNDVVVVANELLDNLPFGIAQWDGERWLEVRIALDSDDVFTEVLVPADVALPYADLAPGTRVPIPRGLTEWFRTCESFVHRGYVVVIDYMTDAPELRLRTYRAHERGADPLEAPGRQDITADVVVDQLVAAASGFAVVDRVPQAEWLQNLGIDALVDEGAQTWRAGAARGDLTALAGRSRVHEAEALTDPAGLGAHTVVTLHRAGRV